MREGPDGSLVKTVKMFLYVSAYLEGFFVNYEVCRALVLFRQFEDFGF